MIKIMSTGLLVSVLLFGCAAVQKSEMGDAKIQSELQSNERVYWVDSLKSTCSGVALKQCLRVQQADEISPSGWSLFYNSIAGFQYEEGYLYKLVVKEESIPADQVPADGSSKKYTLSQIVEKNFDPKILLNDIWLLAGIDGQQFDPGGRGRQPQLEISLQDMRVSGSDGCNNFTGSIMLVDSEKIQLGPLAATRKACLNMELPDKFQKSMAKISTYSVQKQTLTMFDSQGKELLLFRKTD